MRAGTWAFLVRLLVAFGLWSWLAVYLLPPYARVVVPVAAGALKLLQPHGLQVSLAVAYPQVSLQFAGPGGEPATGQVPFGLLAYNAVLYLAVLSAWPGPSWRWRLGFAATAAPVVVLVHAGDLAMAVESQVLSVVQKHHYDLRNDFGLWFSAVKFYNFLSIMALKQVVLVALYYLQWRLLPWRPAKNGSR